MLQSLPIEILQILISHVDAYDLLSLVLVNKQLHGLIVPHIFKRIVINDQITTGNGIKITKQYNLKLLFRKLLQNPNLCGYIQSLVFIRIPDSPEHDVFNYFSLILPNLKNLVEFKWYPDYNLDLRLVNLIPSNLQVLNGNFCHFQFLTYQFNQLVSISLSGLKDFTNIQLDISNFVNLKKLKVSKKNLILIEDRLDNIFNNSELLQLTNVTFENLYLTVEDIELLREKVGFSYCTNLKLLNCYEHNNLDFDLSHLIHLELELINTDPQYLCRFLSKLRLDYLRITLQISHDLNSSMKNVLDAINPNIKYLDLNIAISNNKFSVLDHYNGTKLLALVSKFQNLECLKVPIFFRNLFDLNLKLPKLSTIQFNLLDVIKLKNTLVWFEFPDISHNLFKYISSKVHNLQYIIIRINEFHTYDVSNSNLRVSPTSSFIYNGAYFTSLIRY